MRRHLTATGLIGFLFICVLIIGMGTSTAQDATPTLSPTPTLTSTPGPTVTPGPRPLGCDTALPLQIGELVWVRHGVIIRHQPTRSGAQVNYFTEPTLVEIIGGPVCGDDYYWWQIKAPGNDGWVAEGTIDFGTFLESSGFLSDGTPINRTCNSPLEVAAGEIVVLAADVRVREVPGLGGRVETIAPRDSQLIILGGPECVDGFNWWQVQATVLGIPYEGWMVETYMLTTSYLETADCAVPLRLSIGQRAHVQYRDFTPKALRVAPGRDRELLYTLVNNVPLEIVGGPVCVDGLNWWQVRILASREVVGWLAEGGPGNYWIDPITIDPRYQ